MLTVTKQSRISVGFPDLKLIGLTAAKTLNGFVLSWLKQQAFRHYA
jgi:hypothetical protein